MKMRGKPLTLLLAVPVAGAICAVAVARAQPSGLTCGNIPLTAVTAEPATGFLGACLVPYMTYSPQLPAVCYSPAAVAGVSEGGVPEAGTASGGDGGAGDAGGAGTGGVTYGIASTACKIAAGNVFQSYGTVASNYDSYRVLVTCYPHDMYGKCAQGFAISRSCCDYGANMTSLDGESATGFVNFQ
jgi:hypothetical protein